MGGHELTRVRRHGAAAAGQRTDRIGGVAPCPHSGDSPGGSGGRRAARDHGDRHRHGTAAPMATTRRCVPIHVPTDVPTALAVDDTSLVRTGFSALEGMGRPLCGDPGTRRPGRRRCWLPKVPGRHVTVAPSAREARDVAQVSHGEQAISSHRWNRLRTVARQAPRATFAPVRTGEGHASSVVTVRTRTTLARLVVASAVLRPARSGPLINTGRTTGRRRSEGRRGHV